MATPLGYARHGGTGVPNGDRPLRGGAAKAAVARPEREEAEAAVEEGLARGLGAGEAADWDAERQLRHHDRQPGKRAGVAGVVEVPDRQCDGQASARSAAQDRGCRGRRDVDPGRDLLYVDADPLEGRTAADRRAADQGAGARRQAAGGVLRREPHGNAGGAHHVRRRGCAEHHWHWHHRLLRRRVDGDLRLLLSAAYQRRR